MWKQCILLKDHADVPAVGRQMCDVLVADADDARSRHLEAGNHGQQRRLAGPGWPDDRYKLAWLYLEARLFDGPHVGIPLLEPGKDQFSANQILILLQFRENSPSSCAVVLFVGGR